MVKNNLFLCLENDKKRKERIGMDQVLYSSRVENCFIFRQTGKEKMKMA